MTPTEPAASTVLAAIRSRDYWSTLLKIALVAGVTLLLAAIHAVDWSVFVVANIPRAELLGSLVAVGTYVAIDASARGKFELRLPSSLLLLPPLAATAYLSWEAVTLLLCPSTFELSRFGASFRGLDLLSESNAGLGGSDGLTAGLAWILTLAFLLAITSNASDPARRQLMRLLTVALTAGAILLLLVPVAGPALGTLPLPAPPEDALVDNATAVPRTGFICLPAVLAFVIVGQQFRRLRSPEGKLIRRASIALALLAVLLELVAGRYSLISITSAAVVVSLVVAFDAVTFGARERRRSHVDAGAPEPWSAARAAAPDRTRLLLTIVFFFSGMAALVYQVVFAKGLALTFGSTSHASTIVLATYMGGLALGSWMGGRWAARLTKPVIAYAFAELGIAGICFLAPLTLKAARWAYVALAAGTDPSEPWLVGLQLALGAVVLVPPTWLMGLTLPLLTRQFLDARNTLGTSAGLLYTANTFGAALGASVTGYWILPGLGIGKSLMLAVFTNIGVACFAVIASRLGPRDSDAPASSVAPLPSQNPTDSLAVPALPGFGDGASTATLANQDVNAGPLNVMREVDASAARRIAWVAVVQLTIGGFVTFGLETTFVHLLATVAGTSAYAFSLMLFAFLIGLSWGSSLGRRWLPAPRHLPQALLLCQLVLAVTLLLASCFWDYLPAYFAVFGRWPYTLTFAAREFVRFVVCLVVMLPPAVCIGAQFPIAMEAVGIGWPEARLQALGRASALNTVGNILGAMLVGFVALPLLGSHRTLGMLALLCLTLSAMALWVIERRQRAHWGTAVAAAAVVLFVQPPEFDLTRLSAGGNVYFRPQYYGQVVDHAESLDGGLTAVALSHAAATIPVKTLLTNGKFQGNDRRDGSGEMVAQSSFAIAPLLHVAQRDKALVIGFGTGTTTRVLDEAGFKHIAVAELSGDIVTLADRHFSTINHGVIHQPNVHVHVTDGRNFLLLDRQHYDLISIELSSIWFAGAANLYNDEFYALVEPRLTEQGAIQQWVQLHRLSHRDIMSILVTLRRRFPHVWLYFLGKQGVLVACKSDCLPSTEAVERLYAEPRLKPTLALFRDGLAGVLKGRLLTPEGIDHLISDYRETTGQSESSLLSTDDNLFLEYSTPKGNVRDYDESIADNEAFLGRFRAASPFDATRLQLSALN